MKRIASMLIALSLLASLAACGSFLDILKNNNSDMASAWASKEASYEAGLEALIDYIKED